MNGVLNRGSSSYSSWLVSLCAETQPYEEARVRGFGAHYSWPAMPGVELQACEQGLLEEEISQSYLPAIELVQHIAWGGEGGLMTNTDSLIFWVETVALDRELRLQGSPVLLAVPTQSRVFLTLSWEVGEGNIPGYRLLQVLPIFRRLSSVAVCSQYHFPRLNGFFCLFVFLTER